MNVQREFKKPFWVFESEGRTHLKCLEINALGNCTVWLHGHSSKKGKWRRDPPAHRVIFSSDPYNYALLWSWCLRWTQHMHYIWSVLVSAGCRPLLLLPSIFISVYYAVPIMSAKLLTTNGNKWNLVVKKEFEENQSSSSQNLWGDLQIVIATCHICLTGSRIW